MTDKEFRSLKRHELLELLVNQGKEAEQTRWLLKERTEELTVQVEQVERLKEYLDDKDVQIEHLKARLDDKDEKMKVFKARLGDKDAQIEHLKKRLDQKDEKIRALSEEWKKGCGDPEDAEKDGGAEDVLHILGGVIDTIRQSLKQKRRAAEQPQTGELP